MKYVSKVRTGFLDHPSPPSPGNVPLPVSRRLVHISAETVKHAAAGVPVLSPAAEGHHDGRDVVLGGVEQGLVDQAARGLLGGLAAGDALHDLLVLPKEKI